jgi:ERCC4-type nuclease
VTVYCDVHEKGGARALVEAACEDTAPLDMPAGDYVAGGHVVERKRWAEVAGRMMDTDRDLYHQLEKLAAVAGALGAEPVLLVEGELGGTLEHSDVPPDQIALYLAASTMLGVHLVVSTGRPCTARVLSRWESGEEPDPERARGAVPDGVDPPRFVLEGVPGVGPETAASLLQEFGAVRDVAAATPGELERADGVGPATAGAVHDAMITEWSP